jgi:hypothetical protein
MTPTSLDTKVKVPKTKRKGHESFLSLKNGNIVLLKE